MVDTLMCLHEKRLVANDDGEPFFMNNAYAMGVSE